MKEMDFSLKIIELAEQFDDTLMANVFGGENEKEGCECNAPNAKCECNTIAGKIVIGGNATGGDMTLQL